MSPCRHISGHKHFKDPVQADKSKIEMTRRFDDRRVRSQGRNIKPIAKPSGLMFPHKPPLTQ